MSNVNNNNTNNRTKKDININMKHTKINAIQKYRYLSK